MTDLDALLAAVLADPADDNIRLIYADALDDYGGAFGARHAALIREQVAGLTDGPAHRDAAGDGDFVKLFGAGWWSDRGRGAITLGDPAPDATAHFPIVELAIVRRGFVAEFRVPAEWWVSHGDAVRARHPVERVTLTTVPVAENVTWNAGPPFHQAIQLGGQWVRINEREYAGEFETGVRRRVWELALSRRWPGVAFTPPEPENELLRALGRQLNRELAELAPHIQAANPVEANGTARPRIEQRDVEAFVDEQIAIGRIAPALREQFIRDGLRASRQTRYATTPTPPAGPPPAVS